METLMALQVDKRTSFAQRIAMKILYLFTCFLTNIVL